MTDLSVYAYDPSDSAVNYYDTSNDFQIPATAEAFTQALNEARRDPQGQPNTSSTQSGSSTETQANHGPQAPVLAMAAVTGAGGEPPDKAWAAQIAKDPKSLVGKSAEEIATEFRAHGFPATVQQSTQGSGRAELVQIEKGPVNLVEVHPGGGSHGGGYTKISTSEGKFKYVDPDTYVRRSPEPGTKFFNARTGEPIPEDSLPLRGQAKPKPADGAPSSAPEAKGPGDAAPSVRPPETNAGDPGAAGAGADAGGAAKGTAAAEALGKAGKVLLPLGVAASALQIGEGFHQDGNRIGVHTGEAVAGVAGGWGGAWAGAEGGAVAGAAIGSVVPGVGTAIGGVVGGVIGGIAGGVAGDWAGEHAFDWVKSWF